MWIFLAVIVVVVVYQYILHRVWWSGFRESAFYYWNHEHLDYRTEIRTASDGEEYLILHPKVDRITKAKGDHKHLWICIPGAMKKLSECIECLERDYNAFKGNHIAFVQASS